MEEAGLSGTIQAGLDQCAAARQRLDSDSDDDSDDAGLGSRRPEKWPARSKKGTASLCGADNGLAGCACPPQDSAARTPLQEENSTSRTEPMSHVVKYANADSLFD